MNEDFQKILLDALTEAIMKRTAVTIKSSHNKCLIVVTANENEIIVSLSKMPILLDDIIHTVSEALGNSPDIVYNRISVLKEDFIIYYIVWIMNENGGRQFVEKEYAAAQNNITYLSPKALDYIKNLQEH